jgi:predicted metal-dependent peptidase
MPSNNRLTPDAEVAQQQEAVASWAGRKDSLYERLFKARALLLSEHPFFGRLAMKMRFQVSDAISTAAVRADALCYWNPDFLESLDIEETSFVIAHEISHLMYGHFDRNIGKDHKLWNYAGDLMINPMLVRAGMKMPGMGLYEDKYAEMDDESIYRDLAREMGDQAQQQQGDSQGSGQGGAGDAQDQADSGGAQEGQHKQTGHGTATGGEQRGGGGFGTAEGDCDFDATPDLKQRERDGRGDRVLTRDEWRDEVVSAANAAKKAGKLPGDIDRWVSSLREPELPWTRLLSQAVAPHLGRGSSYQRPSRRSASLRGAYSKMGVPAGNYPVLPGQMPDRRPVVVAIDTSGSMSERDLSEILSEVQGILRQYGRPVRVIACDYSVHTDDDIRNVTEIRLHGGGGSSTVPVFERVEEEPGRWGKPAMCVYFTDLYVDFPERPPPYPVLWVNTNERSHRPEAPFGRVIDMHPSHTHRFEDMRQRMLGAFPETTPETPVPDPATTRGRSR